MDADADNLTRRTLVAVTMGADEPLAAQTLGGLPAEVWSRPGVDVVVIDDASPAQACDALRHWASANKPARLRLLRSEAPLGYGGRRKLACRLAVDGGYSHVLLVPASGHLPASAITQLDQQMQQGGAEVLVWPAKAPGFWAGLLDGMQRRVVKNSAVGDPGGLRAVSADLLKRVPFEVADNGRVFDNQLTLQAIYAGARVALASGDSMACARRAGDAWVDWLAGLQFKLHQMGMVCALTYRHLEPFRYRDKAGMLYSSHAMVLEVVRERRPARLLDIGCGPGHIASRCRELGAEVTGVDAYPPRAGMMEHFHRVRLESEPLPVNPFDYEMVLLMDVIEHFEDPERFLLDIRNHPSVAGARPVVVITTPNIAFFSIRLNLLLGRFNYAERGILDVTHKRLFTRSSLLAAIRVCGYEVESIKAVPAPFEAVIPNRVGTLLGHGAAALAWLMPGLFAFQFMVVCRPLPSVASLLAQTKDISAEG